MRLHVRMRVRLCVHMHACTHVCVCVNMCTCARVNEIAHEFPAIYQSPHMTLIFSVAKCAKPFAARELNDLD